LSDALRMAHCKCVRNVTETRERLADMRPSRAGGVRHAMMDNDIRIAPKGIIETLCDRIAELEELVAIGSATPDTREELVDLQRFLRKLYMISLEYARTTLQ
jgi:hypothetical protein